MNKPTKNQITETKKTLSILIEAQKAKIEKLRRTEGLFDIWTIKADEELNALEKTLSLLCR